MIVTGTLGIVVGVCVAVTIISVWQFFKLRSVIVQTVGQVQINTNDIKTIADFIKGQITQSQNQSVTAPQPLGNTEVNSQ